MESATQAWKKHNYVTSLEALEKLLHIHHALGFWNFDVFELGGNPIFHFLIGLYKWLLGITYQLSCENKAHSYLACVFFNALCLLKPMYLLWQLNNSFNSRAMLNIIELLSLTFRLFTYPFRSERMGAETWKIFCRQLVVIIMKLQMLLSCAHYTHFSFIVDWATAIGRKWGSSVHKEWKTSFCPMVTAIPTDKWHSYKRMECRKNMFDVNQCYGDRGDGCLISGLVYNMHIYYQTTT